MKVILTLDYDCWPLWGTVDDGLLNVDVGHLIKEKALSNQINEWADRVTLQCKGIHGAYEGGDSRAGGHSGV